MERKIVLLYEGEDFKAYAELAEGLIFLHCYVHIWNKTTLRAIRRALSIFKTGIEDLGYKDALLTYTQNPRWVKLVGGKYVSNFTIEDSEYELWELKPPVYSSICQTQED